MKSKWFHSKFLLEFFFKVLNEPLFLSDTKYLCLEQLLCTTKEKVVTLERFASILHWFGPIKIPGRLSWIERMFHLIREKWFHGDIDKQRSETVLGMQKKNSFLVRFSSTDPEKTPFTISKLTSNGIVHQRLYAMTDFTGYFCYIQASKKDKSQILLSEKGDLSVLIKSLAKHQKLENPIGGSPFEKFFVVSNNDTCCYEETPDNNDK